jgi:uncharacterized membrane protein YbaN (DUF454 family)
MLLVTLGRLKKQLFCIIGTIFLGIGIIGIFIPILPTTPFLLLAAFCYMRGSPRLYRMLLGNRFVGEYLKNYLEGKGMPVRVKIWTLGLLWLTIGLTIIFAVSSVIVRLLLLAVLIGVTAHILLIKTIRNSG